MEDRNAGPRRVDPISFADAVGALSTKFRRAERPALWGHLIWCQMKATTKDALDTLSIGRGAGLESDDERCKCVYVYYGDDGDACRWNEKSGKKTLAVQ